MAIIDIESVTFSSNNKLFFDTNIWILLFPAIGSKLSREQNIYSRSYRKALQAGCHIFINVLILSEYVNTFARTNYKLFTESGGTLSFKDYRKSPDFSSVSRAIIVSCNKILSKCEKAEISFNSIDINSLFTEFQTNNADFNDLVIADICKRQGFSLVTHDKDFAKIDIEIFSCNYSLLHSNP